MTKIFIFNGARSFMSMGVNAMTICSMETLNKFIPDAEFTIISVYPEIDHKIYDGYNFNLRIVECGSSKLKMIFTLLREYIKTDVIIGVYGDGFSDNSGITTCVNFSFNILASTFLRKPTVIYPSSMGPFKKRLVVPLIRFAFNRVKAIAVREEITKTYLQEIGVNKPPIHLTADIAFILRPAPYERIYDIFLEEGINTEDTLIGMNISQLVNNKSKNLYTKCNYTELMAQIADYLVTSLGVNVVFVPHEIFPKEIEEATFETKDIGGDDRQAIKETFEKVKNKNKIIAIANEYSAPELKGIIGQCDMFIGARMHSNIAAISLYIPTIGIEYSHKAPGIFKMVGLENYVCDFRRTDFNELKSKVDDVWSNREKIKESMIPKVKKLNESVWLNGKLVKDLLDSKKRLSK